MEGFVTYNYYLRDFTLKFNNSPDKKQFLIDSYKQLLLIDDDGYASILFNRYIYDGENIYEHELVNVNLVPTFVKYATEKQFQTFIATGDINLDLESDRYITIAVKYGREKEVAKFLHDNGADFSTVLDSYIHKVNINPEKHKAFHAVILAIFDAMGENVTYPNVDPDSVIGKWIMAVHNGV